MKDAISACILARNEERRIEDALKSLQGWTERIIVIDNESQDGTVEIARRYGALILTAPRTSRFDGIRNLAIERRQLAGEGIRPQIFRSFSLNRSFPAGTWMPPSAGRRKQNGCSWIVSF